MGFMKPNFNKEVILKGLRAKGTRYCTEATTKISTKNLTSSVLILNIFTGLSDL